MPLTTEQVLNAAKAHAIAFPRDSQALRDWLDCLIALYKEDKNRERLLDYRAFLRSNIQSGVLVEDSYEMLRISYLLSAPDHFEDYMLALEWKRPAKEKFYLPRQGVLAASVAALQRMLDNELDELFLSMPARVGKSTLLLMLVTFLLGNRPETTNLYSAYSNDVTGTFYKGVCEIIGDPNTYAWGEIFPERHVAGTDAKAQTLNIDRRKRYASITCRSIDGSLNGTCDCQGMLVADDLIEGIEEAMSKDRLVKKLQTVQNNLLPRAKEGAKIVWMGTRWSMLDPLGVRLEMLQNDPAFAARRWADINIPALDPATDESNFGYKYGVGFSTEHYKQIRAAFERNNDLPSWFTQYQGQPMERTGTLFSPDDMRFFNGVLPEGEPDRTFAAVDPAWGGGDAVACPIAKQYGEDVYIVDVVYSFDEKTRTQPVLAQRFVDWGVTTVQHECNKMTEAYKEGVEKELTDRGAKINLQTRAAPNNKAKEQRVFDKAPDIRRLIFLEDGKRTKEYSLFMQNVYTFKAAGGNKHDDAPDSLTMLVGMIRGQQYGKVEFGRRPF